MAESAVSFAVDPGQPVGAGPQRGPVAVHANLAQGQSSLNIGGGQGGSSVSSKTSDVLMTLAGAALAPMVKEAQTQQYLSGVQRAAGGEALQEILKDQPWYTEIFGPSSASMGARTYTTQANIATFGAQMEKEMPMLAQQGPEALMAFARTAIDGMMTGDVMTDNTIMGSFVEQLQPLFKRHAKENYIYTQKQASNAQVWSWDAALDAFEERAKASLRPDGGVTPQDMEAETTRTLGNFLPWDRQPDDSYHTNVANALAGAAAKGNFHAIQMLEKQGVIKALPPDTQAALESRFRTGAKDAINKNLPEYSLDMAMLVNDMTQNPAEFKARAQAFNARVAKETGIDERYAQAIPGQSFDNVTGNILRAQAAEDARAMQPRSMTAEEKRAYEVSLGTSLLGKPNALAHAMSVGTVGKQAGEQVVLQAWHQATTPEAKAAVMSESGSAHAVIKTELETLMGADKEVTKGFEQAAAILNVTRPDVAGKYFSSEELNTLGRYTANVRAGVPSEQAFLAAKMLAPLAESEVSPEDRSAVSKAIRKVVESNNEEWYGRNKVTPRGMRILEDMALRKFKQLGTNYSTEARAAMSYGAVQQDGVEVVGLHTVIGKAGQPPVWAMLGKGENNMGMNEAFEAFGEVLKEKAKAVGGVEDEYTIFRGADVGGEPRFLVQILTDKGAFKSTYITGQEIRAAKIKPTKQETTEPYVGYRNPRAKKE